jgi:hypothetical protein
MRLWKPPHTGLSHDADVSFMLQTRAARLGMFLFCASRLRHQYSRKSTSVRYRHDVMSSTREDDVRRRHVLLRCADSRLNHDGVRLSLLSHVLMLVLTQLVFGRPKCSVSCSTRFCQQEPLLSTVILARYSCLRELSWTWIYNLFFDIRY